MRARLMCRTGDLSGNTHEVLSDIIFGRDNESGVVIQSGLISGRHACIRKDSKGFLLEDLGSANGTWLDGERVVQPVRLDHLNVITLAQTFDFIFHVDASAPFGARPASSASSASARPSQAPVAPPPLQTPPVAPPPIQQPPPLTAPLTSPIAHPLTSPPAAEGQTMVMNFGAMNLPNFQPTAPVAFRLEIMIPDAPARTIELARHQRYMIGRAMDCDIPVQEKHVSEHHAILSVGETVMLEDAGSSNGTKVNGELIRTATEIHPGTTIILGLAVSVTLSRQ